MRKTKRYIIDRPAKVEDTIKLFKMSARRVRKINKWVKEVLNK